jgi:hypothetical protein
VIWNYFGTASASSYHRSYVATRGEIRSVGRDRPHPTPRRFLHQLDVCMIRAS